MSKTDFTWIKPFNVKYVVLPTVARPLVKKLPFEHMVVDSEYNVFRYVIDTTFKRVKYYYLYTIYPQNEQ